MPRPARCLGRGGGRWCLCRSDSRAGCKPGCTGQHAPIHTELGAPVCRRWPCHFSVCVQEASVTRAVLGGTPVARTPVHLPLLPRPVTGAPMATLPGITSRGVLLSYCPHCVSPPVLLNHALPLQLPTVGEALTRWWFWPPPHHCPARVPCALPPRHAKYKSCTKNPISMSFLGQHLHPTAV